MFHKYFRKPKQRSTFRRTSALNFCHLRSIKSAKEFCLQQFTALRKEIYDMAILSSATPVRMNAHVVICTNLELPRVRTCMHTRRLLTEPLQTVSRCHAHTIQQPNLRPLSKTSGSCYMAGTSVNVKECMSRAHGNPRSQGVISHHRIKNTSLDRVSRMCNRGGARTRVRSNEIS